MNTVTTKELKTFVDYVYEFYGKDGLYEDFFSNYAPVTKQEIKATTLKLAKTEHPWGSGDSFDREMVRDYMLVERGEDDVEYAPGLRKYNILKDKEVAS